MYDEVKNIFPPHLTSSADMSEENARFLAFSEVLEFIYRKNDSNGETHKSIATLSDLLLFFRTADFINAADPAQVAIHIKILDALANSWGVKAYEQARSDVLDLDTGARAAGYTADEVYTIKKNLLSDFFYIARIVGTVGAIARVLRHFLFENVIVEKTGFLDAKYTGAFNYNGFITYDGAAYFANALFNVIATKPASLTDGQARQIIEQVAAGYKAEQLRLYEITLI